jgi:hypothetical protein
MSNLNKKPRGEGAFAPDSTEIAIAKMQLKQLMDIASQRLLAPEEAKLFDIVSKITKAEAVSPEGSDLDLKDVTPEQLIDYINVNSIAPVKYKDTVEPEVINAKPKEVIPDEPKKKSKPKRG